MLPAQMRARMCDACALDGPRRRRRLRRDGLTTLCVCVVIANIAGTHRPSINRRANYVDAIASDDVHGLSRRAFAIAPAPWPPPPSSPPSLGYFYGAPDTHTHTHTRSRAFMLRMARGKKIWYRPVANQMGKASAREEHMLLCVCVCGTRVRVAHSSNSA